MLAEKKTATNIGVGIGIVLQVAGNVLAKQSESMQVVGLLLSLIGLVAFIWGCINYAQGKGYSGALGILGILSCLGLIILVILPDKHK